MLNTEGFKAFARIENDLDKAKAVVDKLKAEKTAICPGLLENLATEGVEKLTLLGRTIYSHTRIVGKLKSRKDAIEALEEAAKEQKGLEGFVEKNFNTTTLNALLSEMSKNDEGFPAAFKGRIEIDEVITLRSSKS
ncbi:MAG: hypothetical protein HQ552_05920 [Desulfobacteraceae bacterium]|nr:hypothetical protein [Desulfobacteraceae bacterium]